MHPPRIGSAERARCILDFWERRDVNGLQAELNRAHNDCAFEPGTDAEEQERLELLDGIARQLQQNLPSLSWTSNPDGRPGVCHRLLTHLALSGDHPSIRSTKFAVLR